MTKVKKNLMLWHLKLAAKFISYAIEEIEREVESDERDKFRMKSAEMFSEVAIDNVKKALAA